MLEHSGACHQFIDDEKADLSIIVSTGEYGADWWDQLE